VDLAGLAVDRGVDIQGQRLAGRIAQAHNDISQRFLVHPQSARLRIQGQPGIAGASLHRKREPCPPHHLAAQRVLQQRQHPGQVDLPHLHLQIQGRGHRRGEADR
jgi:hypothetical protein